MISGTVHVLSYGDGRHLGSVPGETSPDPSTPRTVDDTRLWVYLPDACKTVVRQALVASEGEYHVRRAKRALPLVSCPFLSA